MQTGRFSKTYVFLHKSVVAQFGCFFSCSVGLEPKFLCEVLQSVAIPCQCCHESEGYKIHGRVGRGVPIFRDPVHVLCECWPQCMNGEHLLTGGRHLYAALPHHHSGYWTTLALAMHACVAVIILGSSNNACVPPVASFAMSHRVMSE